MLSECTEDFIKRKNKEIEKVGRFTFYSKWGDLRFTKSGEIYFLLNVGILTLFFNSKVGRFTLYSKWGDLPFLYSK